MRWTGSAKYNFIGGNNDGDQVPVDGLIAAATTSLKREGRNLATYGLATGPQGYRPLREFLVGKLKSDAGIACTADDILMVSGSLQALDLVNSALLARGDTVICEQDTYQGTLQRFVRLGVKYIGIPVDKDGMKMDALAATLADCKAKGIKPKMIYTIPTMQNPTGTILTEARRTEMLRLADEYGVPIFEDDCYCDLIWNGQRPPALYAMTKTQNVIYCGSFSKSIAPALRVGYVVAPWQIMSQMLALKTDAGSGARGADDARRILRAALRRTLPELRKALRGKLETLMETLNEQFGTAAEFDDPRGGIFLWVKLPDNVDAMKLYSGRAEGGRRDQSGPGVVDGREALRLAAAHLFREPEQAARSRRGIAILADVCRREFGVPARSGNVEKAKA